MTFARVNGGGWALFETLTSAQMNALDINMTRALDGFAGGDYSPSSLLKVHGNILGEISPSRVFLYPLALGQVLWPGAGGDPSWFFDTTNHKWESDNIVSAPLIFDLNRFVPQGAVITKVRAYVDPATTESGNNRMSVELVSRDNVGADKISHDLTYYTSEAGNAADWIELIGGHHDGGADQSSMTDSLKNWVVNALVGRVITNVTDGSSGTITANTANNVTATLSGGTDNDWDDDDVYSIPLADEVTSATRQWYLFVTSANDTALDDLKAIEITYTDPTDYLRSP